MFVNSDTSNNMDAPDEIRELTEENKFDDEDFENLDKDEEDGADPEDEEDDFNIADSTDDGDISNIKKVLSDVMVRVSNKNNVLKMIDTHQEETSQAINILSDKNNEIINWVNREQERHLQNIMDLEDLKKNIKQKNENTIDYFNDFILMINFIYFGLLSYIYIQYIYIQSMDK